MENLVQYTRSLPRGSTIAVITPSVSRDVLLAADQLRRLGLRPMNILLDAESFGGQTGSRKLLAALQTMNVPSVCIAEGESLSAGLQSLNRGGQQFFN
jgi:hypothetical protein